jgi:transposase
VTNTGSLWALARDDRPWSGEDPPGVVYYYAPSHVSENAETCLTGFDSILQIDGYNRLQSPDQALAQGWRIAGRMLKEVFDRDGSEIAAEGLCRIAEFYEVGCKPS